MTPDQKLNHLRDWIEWWIDYNAEYSLRIKETLFFFFEYGMITNTKSTPPPTFDQYLFIMSINKRKPKDSLP